MCCSEIDKAEQFCKKDATVDDVIDAGEAALVCLYSGKEGDNVDGLSSGGVSAIRMREIGVDDKGREPRPCYDGPSSSTRRAALCHQMQLHH